MNVDDELINTKSNHRITGIRWFSLGPLTIPFAQRVTGTFNTAMVHTSCMIIKTILTSGTTS